MNIIAFIFQGLMSLVFLVIYLFWPIIIIVIIIVLVKHFKYRNSDYYRATKTSFISIASNKGAYGEYLICKELKNLPGEKRWLYNLYLPKDNEHTTEIDVIMVHSSGIYVFESKNYSGWIFGTETQRTWTQSFYAGGNKKKQHFYNPIMQNKLHVEALNKQLNVFPGIVYHSLILFSDRCELKQLNLSSGQHSVLHRREAYNEIMQRISMTGEIFAADKVQRIFEALLPFANAEQSVKDKHVRDVQQIIKEKEIRHMRIQAHATAIPIVLQHNHPIYKVRDTLPVTSAETQQSRTCPLCGGKLKTKNVAHGLRKGKKIWGCENFPKCRFAENID